MATADTCCTILPYFKIHDGKRDAFVALCQQFVQKSSQEPNCLYYGWSFDGDQVHCREGYKDADGLLAHLDNVGSLITELLTLGDMTRIEVHGTGKELEKLRKPLADLNPQFFTLEYENRAEQDAAIFTCRSANVENQFSAYWLLPPKRPVFSSSI